jgi:serine/threonine protein phosphatase PrpC
MVSPEPDIAARRLLPTDCFLLLGCDGIFDTIGDQEAIDFIRTRIADGQSLEKIATELLDRCLAPEPNEYSVGTDNMSVIIIAFLMGKTEEDWRECVRQNLATTPAVSLTTPAGMSPEWGEEERQEYLRLKKLSSVQ